MVMTFVLSVDGNVVARALGPLKSPEKQVGVEGKVIISLVLRELVKTKEVQPGTQVTSWQDYLMSLLVWLWKTPKQ